jgi:hypothetical protein
MIAIFFYPIIALSFYLFFVYYSFCDGFNLKPLRKIAWAVIFIWICVLSLQSRGKFDLVLILPIPSVLALALCWFEKRQKK